jgi:GDP-4-dehydro-6-deoxy-D-mannose reductase
MPGEEIQGTGATVYDLDILDAQMLLERLNRIRPDYIFHLAAQSSVAFSWKNPDLTVDVNIKGTLHVLEAIRRLDWRPRLLLIGSGEEYGTIQEEDIPIREEVDLKPGNLYAVTKVCQNMIGKIYSDAYQLDVLSVRSFNHIGPNQEPLFVVADFCKQVVEIERGAHKSAICVGNLSARRDFTDVRDIVRAYMLLMEHGQGGETYNVGSGRAISIGEILQEILKLSPEKIGVEIDPKRFRPVDIPIIEANIEKLQSCTGWMPEIKLEDTLRETLEFWRNQNREFQSG